MAVDPEFLANVALFSLLELEERSALAAALVERAVLPGEMLFRSGDPGDSMFVVHSGRVELFVTDRAGQQIVLHVAEQGDFFGELSLLDGGPRTASGRVVEAGTLYVLDRDDLQQLFRKRPDAALGLLAAMSRMTRKASNPKTSAWYATPQAARKRKVTSLTLSAEAIARLDALAAANDLTRSAVVERLSLHTKLPE